MLAATPIRLRLTLWYVLLLALILGVFSVGVYLALRHSLYTNLNNSLEARANDLAGLVRFVGDRPTLAGQISTTSQDSGEQFIRLYDISGIAIFDTSADGGGARTDARALSTALSGRAVFDRVSIGGETFQTRLVPLSDGASIKGALEVGRAPNEATDTLRALILILALGFPIALALAMLGGVFLASRALSPIDKITRLAQRISGDDLSQRLNLKLPEDEVGRLARTFDDMIGRLDAAFRRQQQFTADASHELRTPLTTIKGQIEVALTRPRGSDAYRDVLRDVNEEVDRLIRLVVSLLTLARADARQIPIVREAVELSELVAASVEQVRDTARESGVDVSLEGSGRLMLQADQDLLLQLLLNLLDNAIKYTPAGGKVIASWSRRNGSALLSVRDSGIGISPEHLPHLFDRFYKIDTARSRQRGGVGLGLSICRWIAEAHGGSISVESAPDQGSTFSVSLPFDYLAATV